MKKRTSIKRILWILPAIILLFFANAKTVNASEAGGVPAAEGHEGHNLVEAITKAEALGSRGNYYVYCADCGGTAIEQHIIYAPDRIELSELNYIYTGTAIEPPVMVYDSNDAVIDPSNYTVSYQNNREIGQATVTVEFVGKCYEGKLNKKFYINPERPKEPGKPSITGVKGLPSGFSLQWKKKAGVDGYQIQYSTNRNFKKAKNIWIESKSATKNAIIELKKSKKYYVRMRCFTIYKYEVDGPEAYERKNNGNWTQKHYYETEVIYSNWSKKKSVTTKSGKIDGEYSAKESPFPLYTIMYGDDGLPYFYGKWGGSANMDKKNYSKTEDCSDRVREILGEKFQNMSYALSWNSVGTYDGMPVVKRYVCHLESKE